MYYMMYSLFKQREVDQEFRAIHDSLKMKIVLTAKQRVVIFFLECNFINIIPEGQIFRLFQPTTETNRHRMRSNIGSTGLFYM